MAFVRVFVRAFARRMSGFLGFEINKDASFAIVAPLPLPASTDGLLARGFRRDVETLGKLVVCQPSFGHRQTSVQVFVCLYDRPVNEWLAPSAGRTNAVSFRAATFWQGMAFALPVISRF